MSAISMAAAAALSARTARAVTLTLYYGQETNYANSNNGVFVGSGFSRLPTTTDAQGESQGLSGSIQSLPVGTSPNETFEIPSTGEYLSIAIDAVLTGNANPQAGATANENGFAQPSYLGLSELGIAISSSDVQATLLTPVSASKAGSPNTSIYNIPSYLATTNINTKLPANGGAGIAPVPRWPGVSGAGEVQPNLTGYDTLPNTNGSVGYYNTPVVGPAAFPAAGTNPPIASNTAAGIASLTQFSTQSNVASYSNATDFMDNLIFEAIGRGRVVLTPFVVESSTTYWQPNGTNNSAVSYGVTHMTSSDVIVPLPSLSIQIGEPLPHSVISTTPGLEAAPAGYGNVITNGTGADQGTFSPVANELNVMGSNGHYSFAQVTNINGGAGVATDTVEAATFSPATEPEAFALDVLVNGTQANASEIQTLINAIDGNDPDVPSSGVIVTTQSPSPALTPSNYNLFFETGNYSDVMIGIDLSNADDPNLAGYTFSAVAAIPVPEPMTGGMLMTAAVGLTMRRRRRRN